ncbi:MAG: acetyl-CoA carboxylase biotin carboxyl carrier protein subunit [Maribacter sp.]|nr:acetyl-CoA carboxylase biotin carboxyl carrier protein subunit [Maribacter sp.]MBT8315647.1 acetyl-CoA carboxylase biotin carboxyl carrier protein subunit [Maribacter sp.]
MDKQYKVTVNDNLSFDITGEDLAGIDALPTSNKGYHILQDNKPFLAEVIGSNFNQKKYTVKVNNSTYDVVISDDLDLLIKEMGFSLGSTKNIGSIHAPMPGLILEINVRVGQAVNEEDPLLILEAMKMENVITSPRDGIIKSISVKQGDAVEKKQLLIEFE